MTSMAEQAGMFMTCPFQRDCRSYIEEHTTVSPEAVVQNVRSATERFVTDSISGRLLQGIWTGETYRNAVEASRENQEAIARSMVTGRSVEPPKLVSRIDEDGKVVQEYANGCERCHGSTEPVFFKPGEQCTLAQLAHRALFNGVTIRELVARMRIDPAAKPTLKE